MQQYGRNCVTGFPEIEPTGLIPLWLTRIGLEHLQHQRSRVRFPFGSSELFPCSGVDFTRRNINTYNLDRAQPSRTLRDVCERFISTTFIAKPSIRSKSRGTTCFMHLNNVTSWNIHNNLSVLQVSSYKQTYSISYVLPFPFKFYRTECSKYIIWSPTWNMSLVITFNRLMLSFRLFKFGFSCRTLRYISKKNCSEYWYRK